MKQIILLFAGLLIASGSYAQITLNSTSYPSSVTGTDSLKVTAAASTFPSFAAATNASWDLTTLTDSSVVLYAYRVPTTSTYEFADSNFYSLSTYNYQGNVQSSIVSAGLLEYGVDVQQAGYSLFTVTGGASDSLIIPTQSTLYSTPLTKISFPATNTSAWVSTYHFNFDFVLTVALASLSHAPGIVVSYTTEQDSVIGWGKMKVKNLSGGSSSWFPVLQVQTKTTTLDSFYVSGMPASSTLLTALGVTQGQVTKTYEQNYYRMEEVTPFANVQFTDSTYSTPSKATTHTQRLVNVGVASVTNETGVTIYPNPVDNGLVSMELPAMGGTWAYELIDMAGRTVSAGQLQTNATHAQLALPSSIMPGIYYVKLSNNGNQVCVKPVTVSK